MSLNPSKERDADGYPIPSPAYEAYKNGDFPNMGIHLYGNVLQCGNSRPSEILLPYAKEEEKVWIGMELEYSKIGGQVTEFTKKRRSKRKENCFFTFKSDGSLSDGIETTTNPFSPSFYYSKGRDWIADFINDANQFGATTYRAWLHLHISRTAGDGALVYLGNIINAHKNFFESIGGRSDNSYAQFSSWKRRTPAAGGDRYMAVNYQPKNTVELRFPASSKKVEEVLGNVENLICLMNFIQSKKPFTYKDYYAFAKADKKRYANLLKIFPKTISPTMKQQNVDYIEYFYPEESTKIIATLDKWIASLNKIITPSPATT